MHCQNVFEQILAVKTNMDKLNASLTSTTNNATALQNYNLTSIRYSKLNDIFMSSGCQSQACGAITLLLPPIRNARLKDNDISVLKMASIR